MKSNIQAFRPKTHQSVAFTGTAGTISNAIGAQINLIRVVVTEAAYIAIAKSPTATSAGVYLPADTPEYFTVNGGEKVSAIQVSSGGTLHVTEMTK